MLEQYDFVIYGTASALIFSSLFFPNISPAAGMIASFGAYAVGFAARPLGGLFFSHFGDRLRPQMGAGRTLLFLMGGSTFLIGCLPTYDQVGLLAPACWSLCASCRASARAPNRRAVRPCSPRPRPLGRAAARVVRHGRRRARHRARRRWPGCSCSCCPRTSCAGAGV